MIEVFRVGCMALAVATYAPFTSKRWSMTFSQSRGFLLVTGGCGFIGSAFIRWVVANQQVRVVNVDALTYAAQPDALAGVSEGARYGFVQADINDAVKVTELLEQYQPDALINFAAESHVDRSITGPTGFARTNIQGTLALLEASRSWLQRRDASKPFRFLQVSTDEVYGDIGAEGRAALESDAWRPSSPYAASKAAADHLVDAWVRTYRFPALVSHASNNYGPWQYPEKLIPRVIQCALAGDTIPLYGSGEQVRDWLHVDDQVKALWCLLEQGKLGEHYNIGADCQLTNLCLVNAICAHLDGLRPASAPAGGHASLIRHVADRAGHDWRYALNSSKMQALGWRPQVSFEQGLRDTVAFYLP